MRKFLLIGLLLAGIYAAWPEHDRPNAPITPIEQGLDRPANTFAGSQSGAQTRGAGTVSRILTDDNEGSRHQRFILDVGAGRTLLIAHNIDLAPRIAGLGIGDTVEFYGEYEWNDKGGVIHWTHRDPQGQHIDGWLKHGGRTYQ